MTEETAQKEHDTMRVRSSTKRKIEEFAERRRMSLVQTIDLALDALAALNSEQVTSLIEQSSEPASPQPAPIST